MRLRLIAAISCLLWAAEATRGQTPLAADLVPETTVAYLEASSPGAMLRNAWEHPLRKRIEALPEVRQALGSPQVGMARTFISAVEQELNASLLETLEKLTARGACFALDADQGGAVVLLRAADEESLSQILDAALKRIRETPASPADFVKRVEYREIQAYRVGDLRVAPLGPWLLLTNNSDLGKGVIDRYLDQRIGLSGQERFQAAWRRRPANASAWSFVDVEHLRSAGVAKELFAGKTDNPVAELLVGGLLSHLQQTPYVAAAWTAEGDQLSVRADSPHDPAWIPEARQFYFGPGSQGLAPPLLQPEGTILTASAYRDIAGMWVRAGDLFEENVIDQLAQADSTFTTLFAGKDFGEEILGALAPELQLVVARQQFGERLPQPAIRLPEFAARFRLADGEQVQDDFRRSLQSLLGFLNVVGAQNGNPQLDFEVETQGQAKVLKSYYVPDPQERDSKQARLVYNFAPSASFERDRLTLASTQTMLGRLAGDAAANNTPLAAQPNTVLRLYAQPLQETLADNREQLIAQNMIEEGRSREEAEQAIAALLDIIGWFHHAELSLGRTEDALQIHLQLKLSDLR